MLQLALLEPYDFSVDVLLPESQPKISPNKSVESKTTPLAKLASIEIWPESMKDAVQSGKLSGQNGADTPQVRPSVKRRAKATKKGINRNATATKPLVAKSSAESNALSKQTQGNNPARLTTMAQCAPLIPPQQKSKGPGVAPKRTAIPPPTTTPKINLSPEATPSIDLHNIDSESKTNPPVIKENHSLLNETHSEIDNGKIQRKRRRGRPRLQVHSITSVHSDASPKPDSHPVAQTISEIKRTTLSGGSGSKQSTRAKKIVSTLYARLLRLCVGGDDSLNILGWRARMQANHNTPTSTPVFESRD